MAAPQWSEVRSLPMSKPNHAQRWYDVMMEAWADQQDHLTFGTRLDGTPKATPDSLVWKDYTITSAEVMPFCALGNRLYLIALPGFRTCHLTVNGEEHEVRPNVPLDFPRYSILVFDEKVARIAFPIHGRMVYGHRIGELYTDAEDNIWEEVWRNAKQIHEEKETSMRNHNNKTTNHNTSYLLTCSLGRIDARMINEATLTVEQKNASANVSGSKARENRRIEKANARKEEKERRKQGITDDTPRDPREIWEVKANILPYTPKEEDVEQVHFPYLEISFQGAAIQFVANEVVVAESTDDTKPLYVPNYLLTNRELFMYITPNENGDVDMRAIRIVECVHELVQ